MICDNFGQIETKPLVIGYYAIFGLFRSLAARTHSMQTRRAAHPYRLMNAFSIARNGKNDYSDTFDGSGCSVASRHNSQIKIAINFTHYFSVGATRISALQVFFGHRFRNYS